MWVRPNQDCCVELVMIRGGNACRMEWEVKGHDEVEASKKKKSEKNATVNLTQARTQSRWKNNKWKVSPQERVDTEASPTSKPPKATSVRVHLRVGGCVYAHSQEPKGTCVISCACVSGLEGLLIRPRKKQITFNEKMLNVRSQYKHVLSKQRA